MAEVTTSFFYGGASAPEQNTTDELLDQIAAAVQSTSESQSAAATSASQAANSASQASDAAASTSALAVQAAETLEAANAAVSAANAAVDEATIIAESIVDDAAAASQAATDSAASAAVAQDWATKTSGPVAGGEYSSKYNAQQSASSATAAASSASSASTSASSASSSASAANTAKVAAQSAQTAAESANTSAQSAKTSAETARDAAQGYSTSASSSASIATTQAGVATTQAGIATTKAGEAATSATNSASSASAASASATSASSSASSAATSATNSASSASDANTAKVAAQAAQTSAESANTSAQSAKTAAETARDAAQGYSTSASSSASTATTQAGIATTQAGIATTKAGEAATSATNSASSASAAATSATNAASSATAAAASAASINPADLVHISGTETITGAKTFSTNPTISSGTANGVAYLNGSKVLTSGSALTFDGTNFATTGTASATKLIPTGGSATGNGMYLPAANTLAWSTNGAEGMRLDSSGNLGLGVTPSAGSGKQMEVGFAGNSIIGRAATVMDIGQNTYYNSGYKYAATAAASLYQQSSGNHYWFTAPSGTAGNAISFTQAMTLDASGNLLVGGTSAVLSTSGRGNISINGSSSAILSVGVGGAGKGWLYTDASNTYLAAAQDGTRALIFETNSAERMRIDSSGNLLVGATSGIYSTCKVNAIAAGGSALMAATNYSGDVGTPAAYFSKYDSTTTTSQIFAKFICNNATTGMGQINGNGSGAAAFGSWSDIRLKENIVDLPPQLENICTLRPVEFDYKTGGHQIGFIAQEMQEIYPDVVGEDIEGMLTITGWSKTEARLVKAIQELKAELDATKAEVAALKGSN